MIYSNIVIFFFFSSRRRHTRYWRDWSSDVCSSDLNSSHATPLPSGSSAFLSDSWIYPGTVDTFPSRSFILYKSNLLEIGRASCRGKSVDLGGRRIIKKKKI